jgi:hypothetical protein
VSSVITIDLFASLFFSRTITAPALLEETPLSATDYLIAGLIAVFVFVVFGRALPKAGQRGTRFVANERVQGAEHSKFDSTRLSTRQAMAITASLISAFAICICLQLHIVVALAILLTSLWASVDSERVSLRAYKTRIALHPLVLFNAMMWLWPLLFPWYLVVCSKIGEGTMTRRQDRT